MNIFKNPQKELDKKMVEKFLKNKTNYFFEIYKYNLNPIERKLLNILEEITANGEGCVSDLVFDKIRINCVNTQLVHLEFLHRKRDGLNLEGFYINSSNNTVRYCEDYGADYDEDDDFPL